MTPGTRDVPRSSYPCELLQASPEELAESEQPSVRPATLTAVPVRHREEVRP